MDKIILKSETLTVKTINKKTNAKMFKDLKVGDKIMFSVTLERAGSNRGRTYATNVRCINLQNYESTGKSFNEIDRILSLFDFA